MTAAVVHSNSTLPHDHRAFGIVGAGAWGTALGGSRGGPAAGVLWAHEPETADAINRRHENAVYLPGVALDAGMRATTELAEAAPPMRCCWWCRRSTCARSARRLRPPSPATCRW